MDWMRQTERLAALARRRLFFIGGAPRSGTTWLQQMMDAHPQVSCRGEGLFLHHFAVPLEAMMAERGKVLGGKNLELFAHTGGYPLPTRAEQEHLIGTAILLAMDRYGAGEDCAAFGEKTPENVFFFPRLRAVFPQARFIGIARDPRDTLSSAWHFFAERSGGSLADFVRTALPSMVSGARAMIAFADAAPAVCRLVTYEALRADPVPVLRGLFGLLGVSTEPAVIAAVAARTDFAAASGRQAGAVQEGAFMRRGVVGDWRDTMDASTVGMVNDMFGEFYARFGWAT